MRNFSIFKICLFIALGLASVVFNACGGDEPNPANNNEEIPQVSRVNPDGTLTIVASNVRNAPPEVMRVVFNDEDEYELKLAEAPFQNNGFVMTAPATYPDEWLYSVSDFTQFMADGVNITNTNAKICYMINNGFWAYDNAGNGGQYLEDDVHVIGIIEAEVIVNSDMYYDFNVCYLFADSDVTIKSEGTATGNRYNLELKKGWNIVYEAGIIGATMGVYLTTQKPDGDIVWKYDSAIDEN